MNTRIDSTADGKCQIVIEMTELLNFMSILDDVRHLTEGCRHLGAAGDADENAVDAVGRAALARLDEAVATIDAWRDAALGKGGAS